MLGQIKNCDACGKLFDESLECCPQCLSVNKDVKKNLKKGFYLSRITQIILFVVGLFGYMALNFAIGLMIAPAFKEQTATYTAIVVFTSYGILFLTFVIAVFPYKKIIFNNFKNGYSYLFGILFAIGIAGFSILYSNFLQYVCHIGVNENQQSAVQLIKTFPILSVFILGIIGPICEELTYRVGLFSLCSRYKRWLAYIISCVIFGFIHFDFTAKDMIVEWCNLPNYIISGLLFCLAYDLFGLPCSFVAHALNNLYSVIITIILG